MKILLILIMSFGLSACAAFQPSLDRSEYRRGYNAAWKFAKSDAINLHCSQYPRNADREAQKKYSQLLQDQGKPEAYIRGFYSGYEAALLDFYELYCTDFKDP